MDCNYRSITGVLLVRWFWFLLAVSATCTVSEPRCLRAEPERAGCIASYDLTYTLGIDPDDPSQVWMKWDHCHAVAAIQGLANRSQPRLYVRYVVCPQTQVNVDDYWLDTDHASTGSAKNDAYLWMKANRELSESAPPACFSTD